MDTYDDYIDTRGVVSGLETMLEFLDLDSGRALVGVIELSRKNNFLCIQASSRLAYKQMMAHDFDFELQ
jgi:hypothetical protein